MPIQILSPRVLLAALALSTLGLAAVQTTSADAAVVCGPRGCIGAPVGVGYVAPVARAGYVAPVARVGVAGPVGVGRVGVGGPGYGRNLGGPVNRVGRF
jgi:hypothetical protein